MRRLGAIDLRSLLRSAPFVAVLVVAGVESGLLAQRNAQAHATERWLLAITLACTALSVLARLGLAMIARFHVSRASLPAAPAAPATGGP